MLNLAKAEMVAKLELLLQQLSTFEAIDQTLEDLSHLAQTDFIGLTFVNYVRRYTERGGDKTALRDLINTLSHSLNDGAIDREQLLGELINQANQLEARTGIYPSTSDGFEDSGKICTDKLEELFIRQQAEEDTSLLKEEIRQLASTYGMFRLLKYIDRFDEQEDYQLVRTLLLQGQEYRIGSQDDREELLESTILSATAADWGVEEFLVNPPPTQETDDVFVSFVDQSEDTSFADNTAFRSLFDMEEEEESQVESQNVEADIQFELVEEEQGVDLDNIFAEEEQGTLHQDEEEPIILERIAEESTDDVDFSFEEIESSQHQEDIVNTNPEQEQLFELFDQTEDIQAPPSEETLDNDLDFSLIEEDNQSNFDVFSQTEEVTSEGQTLTIEESFSSTGFTQDTEELTFSLIEEDVNNQQSNIDIFAGEFTPEPIGEREMFSSASDSSDYDLLSLQEISLTEETGLGEASVVTAEAVSDLSVTTDPPEFLQSLSQEEHQDVTEILDTFSTSTVSSRTSLKELGLLELVLEAIGNDDSRIDYSAILSAEAEELVSTISEGETIVDEAPEGVTVATDDVLQLTDNQDEDVFAQLDLGEATSTEDTSLSSYVEVEEDMTVLQDVPQFFSTISNEDESDLGILEETTEDSSEQSVELAQEEEEPIVASDESEFSFLETPTEASTEQSIELVQEEEEPIVASDESEFSFLETLTEEVSEQSVDLAQEEEPIVATSASDDLPEEEMTILQGLPEFFSSIGTEEAVGETVDDLLSDISQLSSPEEAEQSPIDNIEDEMDALLSEISTNIPHTTEEGNDSIATDQENPEFLNDASFSTEDDDIQQELDQLLSDLSQEEEKEEINIRQFDEETEVIDFEQIFEAEKEDADIDIASFTEDRDESNELARLFGDISDEEVENLTNALAQDDGDDSGFFFSQRQRIDSQPQDDDSEITLLQLFTGDNNEDNVDVSDNVLDDLEEYLEDEQPMSDTNTLTDNVFAELEALLAEGSPSSVPDVSSELDELEFLISQTPSSTSAKKENFDDLDALLGSMPPSKVETKNKTVIPQTKTALNIAPPPGPTTRSTMAQNMRVDVRYLDNINNLVGELIVNRNLLQQDQQRLQASLATLFNQIHKLNDVAQRVRDEFDRSLLERSLQASLGHAWKEIGDSNSGQTKTVAVKSAQTTDALARLDEHDELNNLALDIIELITRVKESASDVEFVIDETEQVSRQLGTITAQIEDDLKQVRMEPFSEISDRLPKQVRDLAMKRKKLADIEISGRDTMIDKVILQGLNTPINHLITNALVHGIEDPEQRKLAGKDPRGKITVKAYHQGNETIISISDDGAGINPEKVRQSAISKGLLTVAEARLLSDQDTYSLLFRPGFSTKAEVDEEGGRGVGLDAVITQLNAIKGSIQVESAIGKGTTFTIRLPLTLSISKAVVCVCNRNRVAFPVDSFEDVVEITKDQVFVNSDGQTCFMWRDREMPFRPLKDMLIYNRQIGRLGFIKQEEDIISIIVLRSERSFLALQVDKFDGEIEIVIKQVEGPVAKPPGIAGVTVLGDGRVMAICNVLELFGIASGTINVVKHDQQTVDTSNQVKATTVLVVDDSVTMRKALVQTFEKAGYRVEEARNGKEAWDKLTSGLFCDLIFTDVEMPQMNGFQLLEKLQKDEQLSRIPVAMLTSQGKRIHIENAANLGAKAYFVKAYTDQEVLEGAERLLRGQVAGKILELFGQ